MIRYGLGGDHFSIRPPYVPGNGVAGQVISAGGGVDPAWIGQNVAVHTGGSGGSGGYAEQAIARVGDLMTVPEGLGLPDAAALLHDGSTAVGLVGRIGVERGEWVLVTAAGGGTGWTERVRGLTGGRGPAVVFDGAGGRLGGAAFEMAAFGGRFSAHGMSGGGFAELDLGDAERRRVTVRGIEGASFSPADFRRLAAEAFSQAAAGRIRPVIGQTFPLDHAADAHAALEARSTIGKTLLLV